MERKLFGKYTVKWRMLTAVFVLTAAFALSGCAGAGATNGTEKTDIPAHIENVKETEDAIETENTIGEQDKQPVDEETDKETADESQAEDGAAEGETESAAAEDAAAGDFGVTKPYAGKKVTICGDSISTFTGYIPDYYSKFYPEHGEITDVNDTWWMQVLQSTGMELCRNASYSGSTVSGQSQDNHDGRFTCGNQRIADLASTDGSSPDVIIVLMGANDLLNDIPLGAYDGVSAVPEGNIETFSEAYALMLDKMKTWYPDAEIFCCTIAEVSRWNEAGEKMPFINAHGASAKDYNNWIKAIANAKGVSVIDVYECGITYENAQENTSDGTHPNVAGAKLIADKVSAAFNK